MFFKTTITMVAMISAFALNATSLEKPTTKEELKQINVCEDKFIHHNFVSDENAFFKEEKTFNFGIVNHYMKDYKMDIFGVVVPFKNEKNVEYFYIKAVDSETKEERWVNTDILTGNPQLQQDDVIKRVEIKICGKNF